MFNLNKAFNCNYNEKCEQANINFIINGIVDNISNNNLDFTFNSSLIWTDNNIIPNSYITDIQRKIKALNKYLSLVLVTDYNILPYTITCTSVMYFVLINSYYKTINIIYITKNNIGKIV